MKIKVDEISKRAIIEMACNEYYLVKTENEEFPCGLAYRIDMLYAGKPDQWSQPVIFLTEEEANKLRGIFDEVL